MTLQVPFESFVAVVGRVLGAREAFLAPHPSGTLVTAADPSRGALVSTLATVPPEEVRRLLGEAGIEAFDGTWGGADTPSLSPETTDAFIAAVAFESSEGRPGVWVDAFPSLPTQVQVLRTMYDEFRGTGELSEVTFEEFVRLANPTVVILSPSDLRSFLAQKAAELC
ncbi:MAG: hypothetical protein ACO1SV_09230 [Fimbriimonas sp.]